MSIKAWSDEQEEKLIHLYNEMGVKDVHELAKHFEKGYRSVISKLVQLKIYQKPDIFNGKINPANLEYLKYNERMWNKIYSPSIDYTYYLIQIADEDVNVIVPFTTDQNDLFAQNERFSLIRWGSQVDLILPLDERFDFELCLEDHMHVEAGIDKLIKIQTK